MNNLLACCRLKSARRKKQLRIKDQDKRLLQMDRERHKLWHQRVNTPKVLLDEPYQRGWLRLYVLKPDIQKGNRAAFYQQILDNINEVQYHYHQSFKKPRRMRRRNRFYYANLPVLKSISSDSWHRNYMQFDDEQKSCFEKREVWNEQRYRWEYEYVFTAPALLEIKVVPNMVTHIKVSDNVLKQRESYLDDYLEQHGLMYRLYKLQGGKYKYYYGRVNEDKPQYANPLRNIPLHRVGKHFE
jgi:hypothetical protein